MLRQGSALSPFLFIMIIDVLTEKVMKEVPDSMVFLESRRKALEEREGIESHAVDNNTVDVGLGPIIIIIIIVLVRASGKTVTSRFISKDDCDRT